MRSHLRVIKVELLYLVEYCFVNMMNLEPESTTILSDIAIANLKFQDHLMFSSHDLMDERRI